MKDWVPRKVVDKMSGAKSVALNSALTQSWLIYQALTTCLALCWGSCPPLPQPAWWACPPTLHRKKWRLGKVTFQPHGPQSKEAMMNDNLCSLQDLSSWSTLSRAHGTKAPVVEGSVKHTWVRANCTESGQPQAQLHLHQVCFSFSSARMWLWRKPSLWLCEPLEPQRELVCWRRKYSALQL